LDGFSSKVKTLRRYYFSSTDFTEKELTISLDRFHHIIVVCRLGEGDQFEALTENGVARRVQISQIDEKRKTALAQVISTREMSTLREPHIKLCLSYPKRETFNQVLVKSVEMGVHSLFGFSSDFSHRGGWVKSKEQKIERFSKIVEGAVQQSGRGAPFHLEFIDSLDDLLLKFQKSRAIGVMAYEKEGTEPLKSVYEKYLSEKSFDELWLFVGSEGGFSSGDLKKLSDFGVIPFGFGDQVLRVETACVAVLGVLKYLLKHYS